MTTFTDEAQGIQLTVKALQAVNRLIQDTRNAPDNYPANMDTAILPCAIVIPQSGRSRNIGTKKESVRDYQIRVYVSPTGLDIADNPIQDSYQLLQRYVQTYLDKISPTADNTELDRGTTTGYRIQLLPYQQQPIADSGVVSDLEYTREDIQYFGFEITIGVLLEWPINCD